MPGGRPGRPGDGLPAPAHPGRAGPRGHRPRGAGGQALYRLRPDGFTRHITCRVCGRTAVVDGHEVWEWARQVAFLAGFTLTGHTVELTGACAPPMQEHQDAQAPGAHGLADVEGG